MGNGELIARIVFVALGIFAIALAVFEVPGLILLIVGAVMVKVALTTKWG